MQEQPQPPQPAPNIDIHLDLSGLAELIWQWLIDHIEELGTAIECACSVHAVDARARVQLTAT